jgi:hypothetical protein
MNAATAPTTPLRRLAFHSTSTCATQASAYGQCILLTYKDVKRDVCKEEFAKFGRCLREAVRGLSPNSANLLTKRIDEAEVVTSFGTHHPGNNVKLIDANYILVWRTN